MDAGKSMKRLVLHAVDPELLEAVVGPQLAPAWVKPLRAHYARFKQAYPAGPGRTSRRPGANSGRDGSPRLHRTARSRTARSRLPRAIPPRAPAPAVDAAKKAQQQQKRSGYDR